MPDHDPTTVDLVAAAIEMHSSAGRHDVVEVDCACGEFRISFDEIVRDPIGAKRAWRLHRGHAVLGAAIGALRAEGRLLPEGGQTREEWGVSFQSPRNGGAVIPATDEAGARGHWAWRRKNAPRDLLDPNAELIRRTVHTGPWEPVPDTTEGASP